VRCRGDFGRLGHGDCSDVFLPRQISAFSGIRVVRIAGGDTHSLVVRTARCPHIRPCPHRINPAVTQLVLPSL